MVAISGQCIFEPAQGCSSNPRQRPASPPSILERVPFSVDCGAISVSTAPVSPLPPRSNTPGLTATEYVLTEPSATPPPHAESIYEFTNRMDRRHRVRKARDRTTGTAAEEAGWQLLKPFINPIDCNHYIHWTTPNGTHLDDVYCMNTTETLNRWLNKEPEYNLKRFGKAHFLNHCRGLRTYYYRCRADAIFSTGFGRGDRCHHRLPFDAAAFGMAGKRVVNPDLGILLLGCDIDSHHGEKDVAKTTGLVLEYFPNAYFEPSTNGQGAHLFVKLTYPIYHRGSRTQTLHYINVVAESLAQIIEGERIRRVYDAPLDHIRGLPTTVGRDKDNRLYSMKRSHVIKIPFYKTCTMEAVTRFYQAPWYSLQDLEDIVLSKVVGNNDDTSIYNEDIIGVNEPDGDSKAGSHTSLSTFAPNRAYPAVRTIESGCTTSFSTTSPNRAYPALRLTDTIWVADLVGVENSRERRLQFGLRLCRQLGRVPSAQELQAEYVKSGLFKVSSKSDNDNNRYDQLVAVLARSFDPDKVEFHYRDYPDHKTAMETMITTRTAGIKMVWRKDKTKPIKIDKLAALFWAMRHSQGKKDLTRFSYKHVVTALKATIGQSAHRNEIARMLAILEEAGLIVRVCRPVWGKLGQGWRVIEHPAEQE